MRKNIFLLIIYLLFIITCQGKVMQQNQKENRFYFFDKYFLNLDTLVKVKEFPEVFFASEDSDKVYIIQHSNGPLVIFSKKDLKKIPFSNPKSGWYRVKTLDGFFACMSYSGESQLFNKQQKEVLKFNSLYSYTLYQDRLFQATPNNGLSILNIKTKKKKELINPEAKFDNNPNGRNQLFTAKGGVIYVKDLESESGLIIYKYNHDGKVLFKLKTDHTKIEKKGNVHYHHRYLNYFSHTKNHLIYTTNVFEQKFIQTTKIVDLNSDKLQTIPVIIHGLVMNADEELIGFLNYNETNKEIMFIDRQGKEIWKYTYLFNKTSISRITTLLVGDILVLGLYYQISTGSDLIALNIKNGKLLWHPDVKQLKVGHSKYTNRVSLKLYQNKVLMLGIEAFGRYLQIFELQTGKRVYCDIIRD